MEYLPAAALCPLGHSSGALPGFPEPLEFCPGQGGQQVPWPMATGDSHPMGFPSQGDPQLLLLRNEKLTWSRTAFHKEGRIPKVFHPFPALG